MIRFCTVFFLFVVNSLLCQTNRFEYENVLNIQTVAKDTADTECSFFSDMGAWFAYSLPKEKAEHGSFIGPVLMKMDGKWLGNTISKLQLTEKGKQIDLSQAVSKMSYLPGLIRQELTIKGLLIRMDLIFISKQSALLNTEIINQTKKARKLSISWVGSTLLNSKIKVIKDVSIEIETASFDPFVIDYPISKKCKIRISENQFSLDYGMFKIQAGKSYSCKQTHSYFPGEKISNSVSYSFKDELTKNELRWNGYLASYFKSASRLDQAHQKLAVKSIVTLMTNWRAAAGDLKHDGVFPSASYSGFFGFWSWDSWKQSVALSHFNPSLAKANIQCMFDYQDEYGMIVDCIYYDKKENNWRDTKPPLATWAVLNFYQQTKDLSFLQEMYPKLLKYHSWWYQNRDCNKNGLCEYGSTDGSLIAAKWESGMDNAVRFDKRQMIQSNEHAWSIDIESVDLNSYLYQEKLDLASIALILNDLKTEREMKASAEVLRNQINTIFYDEQNGFYYDRTLKGELVKSEASEGFLPLWAKIADQKQADRVIEMLAKENKFNTIVPFPTVCADHPLFNPMKGYWRGPVWLDQFYFGIEGMKKYGDTALSSEMVRKLFTNGEGILTDLPIRENYHPITGKGLNAINFSWSAAHILMLLQK